MGETVEYQRLLAILEAKKFNLGGGVYQLLNPKDAIRWVKQNYDFSPKEHSTISGKDVRVASPPDAFVNVKDEISPEQEEGLDREYGEGRWALVEIKSPETTSQIGTKTFAIMVSRDYLDEFRA